MQVDFYQLSRDPAPKIAVQLARKLFDAGDRLLIVSGDDAVLLAISDALWQADGPCFLAHERAGGADDALQPILLSAEAAPANNARHIMIADGEWRAEVVADTGTERVFYLFGPPQVDAARVAWKGLKDAADTTRNFWRQDNGKWVKAA
jgi:DNA polymerase III subunit chi